MAIVRRRSVEAGQSQAADLSNAAEGDPRAAALSARLPGWFWTATVAVSLLVLVVAVASVKSWADLRFSQARADQLRERVDHVGASVEQLRERIDLLQSNSELLERVAREELGVVRADEIVVILPSDSE